MTKHFCDKCGTELEANKGADVTVAKREGFGGLIVSKEICDDCKKRLVEWLKGKSE